MNTGPHGPVLLSIVGKKKSGKTTTLVRLGAELTARGWRVATIKHSHGFEVDHAGRDSFRHRREGRAIRCIVASEREFAVMGDWPDAPLGARELAARFLTDADIVLVEGYHTEALPTIEVVRSGGQPPWYDVGTSSHYLAIAADAVFAAEVPVLDLNDPVLPARLADLVEASLMQRPAGVSPAESARRDTPHDRSLPG